MTQDNPVTLAYPQGSITPHGSYYLGQGDIPNVKLRSYDGTAVFALMGGENIADYYNHPTNLYVKELKGLVPPWKQIDQKGATQDGRSFITSLYDPAEVEATLVAKGKNPKQIQRMVNDITASIDAIQPSELSFFTHQLGRWWSDVRWLAEPRDPEGAVRALRQVLSLRLRAYDSFWRSYDVVDQFRIPYYDLPGDFTTDASALPTGDWAVSVTGAGTGDLTVANGQVVPTMLNGRTAVVRRKGFSTTGWPVVELAIGSLAQWFWDSSTALDFWVMPTTGTPGTNGYRVRVSSKLIQLHHVVSGTETLLDAQDLDIPPKSGESWTFVGGPTFKLLRSGALAYAFDLPGATRYSGAGWGVYTGSNVIPPGVRAVSFGTDVTQDAGGYVKLVNWGDQPMAPRFTCVGPGWFYLGDGPDATDYVQFGPLGSNQIAHILTDERKRGVIDLSVVPVTQPEENLLALGWQDFIGFANIVGGLIQALTGIFGGGSTPLAPQGNLYSLLSGRFSKAVYIPPKPVGGQPSGCYIPVQIIGGNSDSQIICAGTPLRRRPS